MIFKIEQIKGAPAQKAQKKRKENTAGTKRFSGVFGIIEHVKTPITPKRLWHISEELSTKTMQRI